MDRLKVADIALRDAQYTAQQREKKLGTMIPGDPALDPSESVGYAIAAALIALVERRPKFVQLEAHRINVERIVDIEDFGEGINVWMTDGHCSQFYGKDKAAFLAWHEQHADVVRLDVEAE